MKIKLIHGIWVDQIDIETMLQERADQDMQLWKQQEAWREKGKAACECRPFDSQDMRGVVLPNKRNLRLWVKALRSDEYQQIDRTLEQVRRIAKQVGEEIVVEREVKHCCLGVACRVAIGAGLMLRTMNVLVENEDPTYARVDVESTVFAGNPTTLTTEMQTWLGVQDSTLTLSTLHQGNDYVPNDAHPTLGVVEVDGKIDDRFLSPWTTRGHSEEFVWTQDSRAWLRDAKNVAATELNDEAKFTFKMIADLVEYRFAL